METLCTPWKTERGQGEACVACRQVACCFLAIKSVNLKKSHACLDTYVQVGTSFKSRKIYFQNRYALHCVTIASRLDFVLMKLVWCCIHMEKKMNEEDSKEE